MSHIERLKAAITTKEVRDTKFAKFLDEECQLDGIDLRDLDDAERSKKRQQFDFNMLAEVLPGDVVEACREVKKPSRIVNDLKLGSTRARKTKPDGQPNRVFILMRDLEHLVGEWMKCNPEAAPCPTSSPTPSTGSGTSNTPIAPEPSPTSGEPTASP